MHQIKWSGVVLVLLAVSATVRAAAAVPSVTLTVDNWSQDFPAQQVDAGLWYVQLDNAATPGGDTVSLNAVLSDDPTITYGFSVIDFGAPSTFGFVFSIPVALGAVPTSASASLGLTMTDARPYDGLTMTPVAPPAGIPAQPGPLQMAVATAGLGGAYTNLGVDLGPAQVIPGGPGTVVHSYAAGPTAGPNGPWDTLRVDVNFTLSGGSDVASGSGQVNLDSATGGTVPLPAAVWMGLGLMGAMGMVRVVRRTHCRAVAS